MTSLNNISIDMIKSTKMYYNLKCPHNQFKPIISIYTVYNYFRLILDKPNLSYLFVFNFLSSYY